MNIFKKAAQNIRKDLINNHDWYIDKEHTETFAEILEKHIAPLINTGQYKSARIAALKAELQELQAPDT